MKKLFILLILIILTGCTAVNKPNVIPIDIHKAYIDRLDVYTLSLDSATEYSYSIKVVRLPCSNEQPVSTSYTVSYYSGEKTEYGRLIKRYAQFDFVTKCDTEFRFLVFDNDELRETYDLEGLISSGYADMKTINMLDILIENVINVYLTQPMVLVSTYVTHDVDDDGNLIEHRYEYYFKHQEVCAEMIYAIEDGVRTIHISACAGTVFMKIDGQLYNGNQLVGLMMSDDELIDIALRLGIRVKVYEN